MKKGLSNVIRNLNRNYNILFLGFALIILSYLPFLRFDFLYADDYLYLFPKFGESNNYSRLYSIELFFKYFHSLGRPLTGYLVLLQQILIENIQTAKYFRFFSLILIFIIFYLFFKFFNEKKFSRIESFLISFSVISLPTFHLTIAWLTLQQTLLSAIFSILGFLIIKKISIINSYKNLVKIFVSSLLLTFSITLYPVASMFFFIFYILEIFFTYTENNFNKGYNGTKILLPIIIFFITLLINFIILKVYYQSYGSIELNQLSKFYWFLKDIIPLSINFFYPGKSLIWNIFFFIFIYLSFILIIQKKYRRIHVFYSLGILILIIFYSYFLLTPIVIAKGYYTPSFRIIPVTSTFYFFIFIISIKFIFEKKIYRTFIFFIFLLSFFTNNYQSHNYLSKPQSNEFTNMKNILKENLNINIKYIHILRPNWWTSDTPLQTFAGSDYGIYSSSVSSSLKNFVYLALKDINLNPDKFIVSSSVEVPQNNRDKIGDPIPLKNNLIIIDFNNPNETFIKKTFPID